jgi:hypothetical protein
VIPLMISIDSSNISPWELKLVDFKQISSRLPFSIF